MDYERALKSAELKIATLDIGTEFFLKDLFDGTEWKKFLRPAPLFGNKFENYLNENKKASTKVDTGKNNNLVNPSICNSRRKYTQSCDIG